MVRLITGALINNERRPLATRLQFRSLWAPATWAPFAPTERDKRPQIEQPTRVPKAPQTGPCSSARAPRRQMGGEPRSARRQVPPAGHSPV